MTAAELRDQRHRLQAAVAGTEVMEHEILYITQLLDFMNKLERHPRAAKAIAEDRVVFVGHSLGGVLASLLAISRGTPALVFNSPGYYFALIHICKALETIPGVNANRTAALCGADPGRKYEIYNVYLAEDVIPAVFDYQLGYSCPVPYQMIAATEVDGRNPNDPTHWVARLASYPLLGLFTLRFPEGLSRHHVTPNSPLIRLHLTPTSPPAALTSTASGHSGRFSPSVSLSVSAPPT